MVVVVSVAVKVTVKVGEVPPQTWAFELKQIAMEVNRTNKLLRNNNVKRIFIVIGQKFWISK